MAKGLVVLAYSGGLDTSVAIGWLRERYDLDVIAVAVDVGQGGDFSSLKARALAAGAVDCRVIDARDEFARDFVLPALRANALYEGKYPLVSALSRPLISKWLVAVVEESGATHAAHGCTGKGNDQVRFEVSLRALKPDLRIVAPVREWNMTREETIDYAKRHAIEIPVTKASPYSIDANLWGRAAECGVLEDPWVEPPEDVFALTVAPERAPNRPGHTEVAFERGVPVSLNGDELGLVELVEHLTGLAGSHGFGRVDMIENRLVGIKSREVYEAPAALALIEAHRDLEDLTLDRDLLHFKAGVEQKYAELVYYGLWYSPLKEALDTFIDETQSAVTGSVRLKFFKGSCSVTGRESERALYEHRLATYESGDEFAHEAAAGFVRLWGLPLETWARKRKEAKTDE